MRWWIVGPLAFCPKTVDQRQRALEWLENRGKHQLWSSFRTQTVAKSERKLGQSEALTEWRFPNTDKKSGESNWRRPQSTSKAKTTRLSAHDLAICAPRVGLPVRGSHLGCESLACPQPQHDDLFQAGSKRTYSSAVRSFIPVLVLQHTFSISPSRVRILSDISFTRLDQNEFFVNLFLKCLSIYED